jgi:hypothetical protein
MTITGEHADTLLNKKLAAIPVMFDFVNPVLALGRLINRGSKLWLDKSKTRVYAKHSAWCVGKSQRGLDTK